MKALQTHQEQFKNLLNELEELHNRKGHDYSGDDDRSSNFYLTEQMGIPAWKGCLVRMSDKFARLCQFAKTEELKVKDESVIDTLKDMAVYSLLCIMLFEEKNE